MGFEYWVERLDADPEEAVARLNELGALGWELVAVDHGSHLAFLKKTLAGPAQRA